MSLNILFQTIAQILKGRKVHISKLIASSNHKIWPNMPFVCLPLGQGFKSWLG